MPPVSGRSKAFARSLVLVFLTATTTAESLHFEPHHNPHGNRRERIEEARLRAMESLRHPQARRNFNAGGNPDPEPEAPFRWTEARVPPRRPEEPSV